MYHIQSQLVKLQLIDFPPTNSSSAFPSETTLIPYGLKLLPVLEFFRVQVHLDGFSKTIEFLLLKLLKVEIELDLKSYQSSVFEDCVLNCCDITKSNKWFGIIFDKFIIKKKEEFLSAVTTSCTHYSLYLFRSNISLRSAARSSSRCTKRTILLAEFISICNIESKTEDYLLILPFPVL